MTFKYNIGAVFGLIFLTAITACRQPSQDNADRQPHRQKVIGIQPLGNFDKNLAEQASAEIAGAYGVKTVMMPAIDLPQEAFTTIRRPRYRADRLIAYLRAHKPDTFYTVMGLTNKDISITKRNADGSIKKPESVYVDYGIFGLGYQPGGACVVSTFRYSNVEKTLFRSRFFKIAKHEIGHNLGLPHCPHPTCIMQDAAETIKTIDRSGEFLCEGCKLKIAGRI